jgi:hypothetical protein
MTGKNSKTPTTVNKGVEEIAKWIHIFSSPPTFGVSYRDDSKKNIDIPILPSPPLPNINNEGHKNIEQETFISKKKNIVKAKVTAFPTPPILLLNNVPSQFLNEQFNQKKLRERKTEAMHCGSC